MRSTSWIAAAAIALACGRGTSPPAAPASSASPGASSGAPQPTPPADGSAASPPPAPPARPPSAIAAENALPGSPGWRLTHRAGQHEIEGYALRQSIAPGDAVDVAVSTSAPSTFTWIAYRLGHYQGIGAREVARGGPLPAATQAPCPTDPATGLVACAWTRAFTVTSEAAWPSGLYLLKLVRGDGFDAWVPLVLRPRAVPAILVVAPTATWQAYNAFGGESLYDDGRKMMRSGRAFQVSFDRPYATDTGAAHALRWDHRVAEWLEASGEEVGYVTDEDLDREPSVASAARVVVLSAHDEYWTGTVRTGVEAALAGGTSVLLLGANAGYWQIRYGPSADGRDHRVITCYKQDAPRLDPVGPTSPDLTVQFRQPPVSRPENALFGVMYAAWNAFGFPLVVGDPGHWALSGTGVVAGDTLPLVGGYEVDAPAANGATPPGVDTVAEAPFLSIYGASLRATMVVRRQGSALVFAAGGIDFASALAGGTADPRVQRIAANVLARALDRALPTGQVSFSPQPTLGPKARAVTTAAGVAFDARTVDGAGGAGRLRQPIAVAPLPDGSVAVLDAADGVVRRLDAAGTLSTLSLPRLSTPLGLAADSAGNLYVSDTGSGCVRRVDPGGGQTVLAGAPGQLGSVDGPGSTARFLAPEGLAVAGSALYVADAGAGALRRVDLRDGKATVTTVVAQLREPTGVAAAPDGTLYVVESGALRVTAVTGGRAQPLAGGSLGFADGAADQARLLPQLGIAVLPDGAVAVSDAGNYRLRVIRGGQVSTLAGTGRYGGRDGPGDGADLVLPTGLALDRSGRLWLADSGSSTVRVVTP